MKEDTIYNSYKQINIKIVFKNKYAIAIWRKFWNATEKCNEMHDEMKRYLFGEETILYRYQLCPNYSIIMIRFQQEY